MAIIRFLIEHKPGRVAGFALVEAAFLAEHDVTFATGVDLSMIVSELSKR